MTDTVQIAVVACLPPTIASVAAVIVAARKANVIIEKADTIHTLVNSQLTAVKTDLVLALERVAKLEKLVVDMSGKSAPRME